jgi:hypothetical protein
MAGESTTGRARRQAVRLFLNKFKNNLDEVGPTSYFLNKFKKEDAMRSKLPKRLALVGFAIGFFAFLLTGGYGLFLGLPVASAVAGALLGVAIDGSRLPRAWAAALGTPIVAVLAGALYGGLLDGTGIGNDATRALVLAGAVYSLFWTPVAAYVAAITPPARA